MRTLFARLMSAYVALIILVVAAAGGSAAYLVRNYLISAQTADLLIHGREVAAAAGPFLEGSAAAGEMAATLQTLSRFLAAGVWLIDPQGAVVVGGQPAEAPVITAEELAAVRSRYEVVELIRGTVFGPGPSMLVLVPVVRPGGSEILGSVLLYDPLTRLYVTLRQLRLFLLYSAGGAALLSILAALLLSRAISRPLGVMTATALAMARGEFGHRLAVRSRDEVSQLATAFNHLSGELERTLQALAGEKARMTEMITSMAEGVVAVDSRGTVISLNPVAERLLGVSAALVVGRPLAETFAHAELQALFAGCLERSSSQTGLFALADGRQFRVRVSPISSEGAPNGAVGLLEDVSEARRLEQRQRDFVANVAHELRTPLTAVRGYLEPLIDGTLEEARVRERYLKVIHGETLRLAALVNDLLDLAQLESEGAAFETEPTAIADVITPVLERLQPVAATRSVTLEQVVPTDLPLVPLNPDRIDQVLVNLLANAIRFSPEGGRVVVSVRAGPTGLEVLVSDSGPGVASADLPYVWDRFYKGDKARTGQNAGVGLAIVRQIIERHAGQVIVQPSPTGGASFGFVLKPEGPYPLTAPATPM